jgi:oligosaccharide repeat unit polymerase
LVFLQRQYKSFVTPPVFFAAYWIVQLFVPVLLAGSFYYSGSAFLFIYFCVLAFAVGFMLATHKVPVGRDIGNGFREYVLANENSLLRLQFILLVFGAALSVYELTKYGYSISKIQSLAAIESISRDISIARAENAGAPADSAVSSLLKIPFYASFLVSGMLVRSVPKRTLYKYLNFVFGLFLMLITTKKTYLLNPLVLFFATYFLVPGKIKTAKAKFSRAIVVTVLSASLVGLFFYSQANRYGMKVGENSIVLDRMKVYFFGHASVFSLWYDKQPVFDHYELGKYNFSGIISVIDKSSDLKEGVFTDFTDLSNDGLRSNIYTAYRGWLEDFGYFSVLVHLVFGLLTGVLYREYKERRSPIAFVLLSMFYAYVLWSFVVNLFNYTTIFLAYFLLALNLKLWNRKPVLS